MTTRPVTGPHPETGEPTTWPGRVAAGEACGVSRWVISGWLKSGRAGWSYAAGETRRPWTDAETEALASMAGDGKTDAEIAVEFGRSQWSVKSKRGVHGIETAIAQGRPRVHDRQAIGSLLDEGMEPTQIARELGMYAVTVRRIAADIR